METPIPTTAQRRAVHRAAKEIVARTDHILLASDDGPDRTAAAELLGKRLGADLYRVDLSAVMNKYIGETEKNLEKVLTTAEELNAVLFLDEADALFGKRTEINDGHDRYADMDVDYILQRANEHGVMVVFGTGRTALDTRLPDRLALILRLPRRRKHPIPTIKTSSITSAMRQTGSTECIDGNTPSLLPGALKTDRRITGRE